ncbi:hypothetical protein COT97_05750 [Candidatus Falkowbacteria bacterium CG10_big_fil_rev_8_21_14_0_10_39_11]|uniref:DNA 3'-5' helicase n=1 Tax=Candidatus Falkowbacteria bacterium CG10_big_fil_rev_8_21_14_0_10_39_11 TaxID=1974565 RepID=A0A2H0V3E0_9BACT|nr:MAG: hypothetical protein COT97_05750 [Candidatus Falkowbacteria bacterium CG10_big_fil_rev_8_21_14_0_10_39_11]
MEEILKQANEGQKKAITHDEGPALVVAGAGTGKTRVITQRIAYLIQQGKAKPENILALTFTEKAAAEMEERVDVLLPYGYVDLWISTFHSFCDRILRDNALDIGLPNNYKLLDETQAWILVRKNLDLFNLDYYRPLGNPTKFIHALLKHFSRCKDEGILPEHYLAYAEEIKLNSGSKDFVKQMSLEGVDEAEELIKSEILRVGEVADAYHVYQQLLLDNEALDFADLLIYTLKLFKERPLIKKRYQNQFKYILVDEFQDTNFIQSELVKEVAAPKNNLMVVGDDDQSIYRFRGSSIENIMQFKDFFPEAKEIVLTDNYRSTQEILDLSYKFIKQNNPHRLEASLNISKQLKSHLDKKGIIEHLHFDNNGNEADGVVQRIIDMKNNHSDLTWSDFAILVRANDSAEYFVSKLDEFKVPYQFLALRGLYSKSVVVDVINFFRLLDNYHEGSAVYRVLQFDCFGLDQLQVVKIIHHAGRKSISLYDALTRVNTVPGVNDETITKIRNVVVLINKYTQMVKSKKISEILVTFMHESGYVKLLAKANTKAARESLRYLDQFLKKVQAFETAEAENSLKDFMSVLKMEMDAGNSGGIKFNPEEGPDMVRVMSIHMAKGLEFKYVFLVNLVDRKFPTDKRSEAIVIPDALLREKLPIGDYHLEEERRLFYVAATRAKEGLFFTSANDYGGAREKKLSRFLLELGYEKKDLIKSEQEKVVVNQNKSFIDQLVVPKSFSFSTLSMYQKCPFQFYCAKILKIPTPGKAVFTFGNVIHRSLNEFVEQSVVMENVIQGNLFGPAESDRRIVLTLDQLYEIYEKNWLDDWYEDATQKKKYYKKGKGLLKAFYEDFVANKPNVAMLEQPFALKLNNYKIIGRIDRVDSVDGGVEIIDYKTGTPKDESKLTADDKQQLMLYQIAAEEVMGLKAVKLTFHYLENSQRVSFLGNDKQKEKLKEKWLDVINKIVSKEFLATPSSFVCDYCDYKDICPYRKI